jgi:hypothetical protein
LSKEKEFDGKQREFGCYLFSQMVFYFARSFWWILLRSNKSMRYPYR